MVEVMRKDKKFEYWFSSTTNLTYKMQEQLYKYFEMIQETNKVMNLTGIDDLEGVYLKHFYDCLTINNLLEDIDGKKIGDLGSGAGFPGIVLAICFPKAKFYLIEPITKRTKFLEKVVKELKLENVYVLNKRIEDVGLEFDIIVSRAVAKLNILLELSMPFLKVNGVFIALKASSALQEIDESQNALKVLNSKILQIDEVILPVENSVRNNIIIKKIKEINPKYPRNFGQIKKKPL